MIQKNLFIISLLIYIRNGKGVICKGLNFAISPTILKFENYLLPFKILFRDLCDNSYKISDDDYLLDLKCKIEDLGLSSFRWYNKKDHRFENLIKDEYTAFLPLKSNNNIIIQRVDKGNTVVILQYLT